MLDSRDDDIQHQGAPAQAEGGDEEDVQGGEVLDQRQLRPIKINRAIIHLYAWITWISIAENQDNDKGDSVSYGPMYC